MNDIWIENGKDLTFSNNERRLYDLDLSELSEPFLDVRGEGKKKRFLVRVRRSDGARLYLKFGPDRSLAEKVIACVEGYEPSAQEDGE